MAAQHTDMDYLPNYYIHHGGCGSGYLEDLYGPAYVSNHCVPRGPPIGSLLTGLFQAVNSLAILDPRALGREALNTGAQIIGDAVTNSPNRNSRIS